MKNSGGNNRSPTCVSSIEAHLAALEDPRIDRTKKHKRLDILTLAIGAVIGGASGWVAVEALGYAKFDSQHNWSVRTGFPPTTRLDASWVHSTLSHLRDVSSPREIIRLSSVTDNTPFISRGEIGLLPSANGRRATPTLRCPIDGKPLRRSHDRLSGKWAKDLVRAWSRANGFARGQVEVSDKSNEITAIPTWLEVLDVSGCIVTIDAMGCQTESARQMAQRGGR